LRSAGSWKGAPRVSRSIKRGEIYWVDFEPVRGSEQGRLRPALVVQGDVGNLNSPLTIVIPFTSRLSPVRYPQNVFFSAGTVGLTKDSELLVNQIKAVDKSRLGERLGVVSDEQMEEVEAALLLVLGMERY